MVKLRFIRSGAIKGNGKFWSCVRVTNKCWRWTGPYEGDRAITSIGTGTSRSAARIAYQLWYGTIVPRGKYVRRSCCNFNCVKPNHLYLSSGRGPRK